MKFADPDTAAPDREREAWKAAQIRMEDLVEGRHVIIVGKEVLPQISKEDGKPYDVINSDVIILDGRKTEKIPEFPRIEHDLWVTGGQVVTELRAYVGIQPVLGYLTRKKNAYWMDKAEPGLAEGKLAQDAWKAYESGGTTQKEEPPF